MNERNGVRMQPFTSSQGWYSLEYPATWEVEIIENIPSFFDGLFPKGGVFQIFSLQMGAIKDSNDYKEIIKKAPYLDGQNAVEKMEFFLDAQDLSSYKESIKILKKDAAPVAVCEYTKDRTFYFASMTEKYNKFILMLFNAPYIPDAQEAAILGSIVNSLEIHPS